MDEDKEKEFQRVSGIGKIRLAENFYLRESGWVSRIHLKLNRVLWFPPGTDPKTADRAYDQDGAIVEQRKRDAEHWRSQEDIAAELHPLQDRQLKGKPPPIISSL